MSTPKARERKRAAQERREGSEESGLLGQRRKTSVCVRGESGFPWQTTQLRRSVRFWVRLALTVTTLPPRSLPLPPAAPGRVDEASGALDAGNRPGETILEAMQKRWYHW